MTTAENEIASRWAWSLLPWAALAIIFGAVPLLPPTDCYDAEPPTALGTTPYVAVVAAIVGLPILFSPRGNNIATLAVGFVVAVGTYVVMVGGFLAGHTSEELGLLVPSALLLVAGMICAPLAVAIIGIWGGGIC